MDYQPPVSVGLSVARGYGRIAWGLASTEEHFLGGEVPASADAAADETSAFLAGFETLLNSAEFTGRGIDLYCPHEGLCETLAAMPTAFPHLTVMPRTELTASGFLVRAARKAAFSTIQDGDTDPGSFAPESTDVDTGSVPRVVAATDGSAGFRRGVAVSGWGWVTSTGLYEHGPLRVSNILAAELYAVYRLLRGTPKTKPLTVLVDSQAALRIVADLRAGAAPTGFGTGGGHRMTVVLRRIAELCEDRDVRFEWVPSHSGHPLNEGADRLAVQARRHAQTGVDKQTSATVAAHIVAETLAAHRAAPLPQALPAAA